MSEYTMITVLVKRVKRYNEIINNTTLLVNRDV